MPCRITRNPEVARTYYRRLMSCFHVRDPHAESPFRAGPTGKPESFVEWFEMTVRNGIREAVPAEVST